MIYDDDVTDIWLTLNDILLAASVRGAADEKNEKKKLTREEINAVIKARFFDELYAGDKKDELTEQLKSMAETIIKDYGLYIADEQDASRIKDVLVRIRDGEKKTGDFDQEETEAVVHGARCIVATNGERNDGMTAMLRDLAVEDAYNGIKPFIAKYIRKILGAPNQENVELRTDLMQEAMKDIWQSLQHFDLERGIKLSTYTITSAKNAVASRFNEKLAEDQDRKPDEMRHINLVSEAVSTLQKEDNISRPTIRQIEAQLALTQTKKEYRLSYDVIAKTLQLMTAQKISLGRDEEGNEIYPAGPSGFEGGGVVGDVGHDLRYRLTEALWQLHPEAVDIGIIFYKYLLGELSAAEADALESVRMTLGQTDEDLCREIYFRTKHKGITSATAFKNNYQRVVDVISEVLQPTGVAPYVVRVTPDEEFDMDGVGSLAPDDFDDVY